MSKLAYVRRYNLIINKLRAKPYSTFEEIQNYINRQMMYGDTPAIAFSLRTLQRDMKDIYAIYKIIIEYSKTEKGYFISHDPKNENTQRLMEAFDIFNSLNVAQDIVPYIHLEKRRPQGTENLFGLLHAIKNKQQILFTYEKFWDDTITQRNVEPYALKEFRNRWYILAKDLKDGNIKSFALDRLTNLEITNRKFIYPTNFNVDEHYRYCFGIISPNEEKAADIVLQFEPHQGKYIKSLPLHHTQQIIVDNNEEVQVKLKLCLTHDFIMELLSFGENMKVLSPASLIKEIKNAYKTALKQYEY